MVTSRSAAGTLIASLIDAANAASTSCRCAGLIRAVPILWTEAQLCPFRLLCTILVQSLIEYQPVQYMREGGNTPHSEASTDPLWE